jgi:hypothetical protein
MSPLRLRAQFFARLPAADDDAEGEHLVATVRAGVARRARGAAAVIVRSERTEFIDLGGVIAARAPVPLFLAGLTRSEPDGKGLPLAVGMFGQLRFRAPGGAVAPVAIAFLEWPDCRWWHWRVVLDASGAPVPDTETIRRASDGDALPAGLGRWWSLGRRTGRIVRYQEPGPAAPIEASSLVH